MDTAVLEVGLGGRLDATNVVHEPYVCGIAPLGFDHMEILGHTLPEIAAEKAGIFKAGAPAFTVPQPADAMQVLQVLPAQEPPGAVCMLAEPWAWLPPLTHMIWPSSLESSLRCTGHDRTRRGLWGHP